MNKLSSILGGAAVLAIAVVFILQFRPATGATKTSTGPMCVAEVNGSCVSAPWFWASYRLIAANADPARLRTIGFRRKVADGLIETWLLNQDASRLGITVADDDVRAEVAKGRAHVSLPVADAYTLGNSMRLGEDMIRFIPVKNPKTKQFELKIYEKEVPARTHLSVKDFLDYQRAELVAARVRELIRSQVRIGDTEAYEKYARDKSTVTLEYVRFDRRYFGDVVVDPSTKNVEAWAEQHKDEIDKVWEARKTQVMPECRTYSEILVKVDDASTDDEKARARAKIDRAHERVALGESFAEVARRVSEGPSASRGGLEGCLLRGKPAKPVEDAVLHLEPGKVSDVITTERGFVLLTVSEIAKDDAAEKAGRSFVARELYVTEESERLAVDAAKGVLSAAKAGKALGDAVDAFIEGVARAQEALTNGKGAKSEKKGTDKPDKVSKEGNKSNDDGPTMTARNHPNRPTVETTLPFNMAGSPISGAQQPGEIARVAFGLDKPGDLAGDLAPLENGYAVLKLKDKAPASQDQWEKDREYYVSNMRAVKAQDALVAYVARLRGKFAKGTKYVAELVNEPKSTKEEGPAPADDDQGE